MQTIIERFCPMTIFLNVGAIGISMTQMELTLKLRNGKNKLRLESLNKINHIDKRLKKKKVRDNQDETSKLISQRKTILQKLKTSR